FAFTVVLPKNLSPYMDRKSITSDLVLGPGIISNNSKYLGGLKKCVPQKCFWKSSDLPSLIRWIGIPDVFEVISVPGVRYFSTFSKTCFLISNRSITTSITQSTSLI